MQRKEPFFRPAIGPADKLREYRETVARLRSLTDELERRPLHPVATEAIRHCLTLIERCGSVPTDGTDHAPANPQTQVAVSRTPHRTGERPALRLSVPRRRPVILQAKARPDSS